jgi:hypothetical protein
VPEWLPQSRNVPNLPNPNDVSPTTSHDLRCPQCSAHTSPGADWCTLCFADLRPPPPVEELPEPPPPLDLPSVESASGLEEAADSPVEPGGSGNGKHARAATTYDESLPLSTGLPRDAASMAELDARAVEMLAQLAADTDRPLGPIAARLDSTSAQAMAAGFGFLLLVVIALLVMTVLGHFI